MKKLFAVCLIMALIVNMGATVFAAPGAFVKSPSDNPAPEIVDFVPGNEGCSATIVITPYGDREQLPESLRELIEQAYNEIATSDDLTKLNEEFAKHVSDKGLDGIGIAVSDLFDISYAGCTNDHGNHKDFRIVIDADTLDAFVGLLHMKQNGEWEFIESAKVINDGEHLEFYTDTFSPFAIVVEIPSQDVSQPGGFSMCWIYLLIMILLILAIIIIVAKRKKKRNK